MKLLFFLILMINHLRDILLGSCLPYHPILLNVREIMLGAIKDIKEEEHDEKKEKDSNVRV